LATFTCIKLLRHDASTVDKLTTGVALFDADDCERGLASAIPVP